MNPGVTITDGPSDWQIIQRDSNNAASITIRGLWKTDEIEFSVQGRLVFEDNSAPVARNLDWQDAVMDKSSCSFELTLKDVPCGGLYRLETRVRRPYAGDKRFMRGDYIHYLGVGDIYLITGQSNASGTGKGPADDPINLGVHMFANDENWKIASHPIEDATRTLHPITITGILHGTSPWLAFGKHVMDHAHMPIGLIPTALGGSTISMWVTDDGEPGVLFENMEDMLNKAGGRCAGILWYQGESDASAENAEKYSERFRKLVSLFEKRIWKGIPILTAQLSRFIIADDIPELSSAWTKIREMQRSLASELPNVYIVPILDCPMSDEIHNSSFANIQIGKRYADMALEHIYGLNILSAFPEPETVKFTDSEHKIINMSFKNLSGDWTPNNAKQNFTIEDSTGCIDIEDAKIMPNNDIEIYLSHPTQGTATLHGLYGLDPQISLRDDDCRCMMAFSINVE